MKAAALIGVTLFVFAAVAHARCVDIALRMSGRVTDAKGSPLEKATVRMEWKEIGGLNVRTSTATTDARGQFSTSITFYPWREPEWFWQPYRCDLPPPLLTYRVEASGHVTYNGTIQSKHEGTELHVSLRAVQ